MAKDLFKRYIWLVDLINRSGYITFREINEKWSRSSLFDGFPIPLKTFHNHKDRIQELFDINIECDKRRNEYFIEDSEGITNGSVQNWLIKSFSISSLVQESKAISKRIQIENIPSAHRYLTDIIEAMRDGLKINITYQSFWRDSANTFMLEPYFVKLFHQRWYVIGKSTELRIYSLDRILNLEHTHDNFSIPDDFDSEVFFQDCFGIINDADLKVEEIRVKVYEPQVKYISSLPWHSSQKVISSQQGFSIFQWKLKPSFDFRQELLSQGEYVEVLEPNWLREDFGKMVKVINSYYE